MLMYTLETGPTTFAPPHAEYLVNTVPITHTLCGALTYSATYDSNPINSPTDQPLGYNPATREFTAESTDLTLDMMTKDYTVRAEFTNYPLVDYNTVSTAEQTSTITFEMFDPCDGVVLTPAAQSPTVPAQAGYDSTDVVFTYTPYTADPVTCPVTTNCMSVTGPDPTKLLPCQ